jgi:hypothetical protein
MIYYECYLYRADGTVCGASPLLRRDDQDAMEIARHIFAQRNDARRFELWQDERQVHVEEEVARRA